MAKKTVCVRYFAALREQRGLSEEKRETLAETPAELYEELKTEFGFPLRIDQLRVATNSTYVEMTAPLKDGDVLTFIPPVAGG
ncbi:MAG: MoaD/ThiS family protein [Bdellovibrionaceae bacterium]|nr:MoaD/ThiS family protein [Bdellovibrionales bacterium]MCB9085056.1 MoaD/ThiS family protein [Pseudobdellovibrionaceae bacterium]